jgi:hypothetical protein
MMELRVEAAFLRTKKKLASEYTNQLISPDTNQTLAFTWSSWHAGRGDFQRRFPDRITIQYELPIDERLLFWSAHLRPDVKEQQRTLADLARTLRTGNGLELSSLLSPGCDKLGQAFYLTSDEYGALMKAARQGHYLAADAWIRFICQYCTRWPRRGDKSCSGLRAATVRWYLSDFIFQRGSAKQEIWFLL